MSRRAGTGTSSSDRCATRAATSSTRGSITAASAYNYRLTDICAAIGVEQIKRLPALLAQRARVAGWYSERLQDVEHVETPRIVATTTAMSWFVYVIRILPPADRTVVLKALEQRGIPSRPYFTPIHLQPFYQRQFGYTRGMFPVTEYLGDVSLALPFSGVMTESQVDEVCETLKDVLPRAAGAAAAGRGA